MENIDASIIIQTKHLTKKYADNTIAVNNLSLNLEKGKIYGFLGPNGAGKTTTIHLIMGILTPSSGSLSVLGVDPTTNQKYELRKRIGFMPQDIALYDDLTPLEHCIFFGRLAGMKKDEAKKSALSLLELFNLSEKANTPVHNLSGGTKRRTSLIVALVHQPELIILDEPTVGVDPTLRRSFWNYFRELNKNGATFLVTTHVFDEVEKMDQILLMHQGNLLEQGTPHELYQRHNVKSLEDMFLQLSNQQSNNVAEAS
jgi:ABC-2 type transport system ATP-binding protein